MGLLTRPPCDDLHLRAVLYASGNIGATLGIRFISLGKEKEKTSQHENNISFVFLYVIHQLLDIQNAKCIYCTKEIGIDSIHRWTL